MSHLFMKKYIKSTSGLLMGLQAGIALVITGCSTLNQTPPSAALQPALLRCENRVDPLGIDETQPRLSWIVESAQRGASQSACEILVASSPELLQQNHGDLWDSGKQTSDETIGIVYAGAPLSSQEQCYWKVCVWDQNGNATWSEPAHWSMGLLQPDDWKADWIGYDAERLNAGQWSVFAHAEWIWYVPDGDHPPKGSRLFWKDITLPAGLRVKTATLTATADDSFHFVINQHRVLSSLDQTEGWRHPQTADVTQNLQPGSNRLLVEAENAEASPAGLLADLTVTTDDGQVLQFDTDGGWQAAISPGDGWDSQPVESNTWSVARIIGGYGVSPWGKFPSDRPFLPPAPYLRTHFQADRPVKRATLYASALGLVEVHLNGQRVSDDFFTPGWTDYHRRVHYRTYDVTSLVRPGENALGAILADGWYSGYVGYARQRDHYGTHPRVRVQLQVEYVDGTSEVIGTSPDWKANVGPLLEADFLKGETYDARKTLTGWDQPGFQDTDWHNVVTGSEVQPLMQAHPGPPVRIIGEFKAKSISEPKPGRYVINLGQNFAGVARLTIAGQPGQKITMRFAERLNPDGTIYTTNLRSARTTDTYVCKGDGMEVWEPHFTYHGFQYVEVTGLTQPPTEDTVVGLPLGSDSPVVGSFTCSDPMLNQLHNNIYWTQRANFMDIPTDCPQRDERLGWTGDAQVYCRTATLNCDMEAFYTKWLVDLITDGQRSDGEFPMVAPVKVAGDDGGPAWADSGVICPWTVYEVYGDRRVLEHYYPAMTRFIAFCKNRSTANLLPPQQYQCFGDWLNINDDTPKDVICTAYFAYSTKLTARTAEVLGKNDDAAKYNELFDRIKAAFNQAYVADDGRISGDSQTAYVLALKFDLLSPERAKLAGQHLVENIQKRNWHLSTGFVGTKDLMLVLSKIGRNDVAERLIHQDTFPSWGFSIKHGATSIWERWDGWTPDKGFQDPGMNSFAHYSFGAVYQWMVENLGGIRNDAPAYKRIVIAPYPDPALTSATTSYACTRGLIKTSWQRHGNGLDLDVSIPANTTATVYMPKGYSSITESGQSLQQADGVKVLQPDDQTVVAIESGLYHFQLQQ